MIKKIATTVAALALTAQASANSDDLIVKDSSGLLSQNKNVQEEFNLEPVFPSLGIYKVKDAKQTKEQLQWQLNSTGSNNFGMDNSQSPKVFVDHVMTLRQLPSEPNDEDFAEQWSLQNHNETYGINAKKAWNITKGEKNALDQEVVVAAVDGGFDLEHEDLVDNVWVNTGEIPDNGIDDDNNGYIDDINGWNAVSSSGDIQVSSHGTHVIGTMGATGNNDMGVVGVNWSTKLMTVSAGRSLGSTSTVLKAYNYILDQKKRWIETNGEEGANVVAINSSFGIDFADCTQGDYVLWNDVYNELGKYGILSIAATANRHIDVDKQGDVPTGCSSPYIVGVTNSTDQGEKNRRAAYGFEAIDLAAPGTGILSTLPSDRYGNNTGTSMATPHVAGSVGLVHAAASKELAELATVNPGAAALIVKDILLSSVSKASSLEGLIKSAGILNVAAAAEKAHAYVLEPGEGDDSTGDDEEEEDDSNDEPSDDTDEQKTFVSNEIVSIDDAFIFNGVSETTIADVAAISSFEDIVVEIDIQHSHMEDLSLTLVAPNGRSVILRYQESGSDSEILTYDSLSSTFEPLSNLGSDIPEGTWTLRATDHNYQDVGQINGWSISLK